MAASVHGILMDVAGFPGFPEGQDGREGMVFFGNRDVFLLWRICLRHVGSVQFLQVVLIKETPLSGR